MEKLEKYFPVTYVGGDFIIIHQAYGTKSMFINSKQGLYYL